MQLDAHIALRILINTYKPRPVTSGNIHTYKISIRHLGAYFAEI